MRLSQLGTRMLAGFWFFSTTLLPGVLPLRAGAGPVEAVKQIQGSGTIRAVDRAAGRLTVTHGPIRERGLPAMTTSFRVHASLPLGTVRPGQRILFTLDGDSVITALEPLLEPEAIPPFPEP